MKKVSSLLCVFVAGFLAGFGVLYFSPELLSKIRPDQPKGDEITQSQNEEPGTTPATETPAVAPVEPTKPVVVADAKGSAELNKVATDPNVVAEIGKYVVTKQELEQKLTEALRPYGYDEMVLDGPPPDANSVLMEILAEKAMMIEGRRLNYHEREMAKNTISKFRARRLTKLLYQSHLEGRVKVTDPEIERKMKTDPKMTRERARQLVEREKAGAIIGKYYDDIYERSNIEKVSTNYLTAAQLHMRLLRHPKTERKMPFIRNSQMREELTAEEKAVVLATFNGGKVTVMDWFKTLGEISPPSRPRDLSTPQGVEKLLDRTLRTPLVVAEAERLGLEKDPGLLKQVREYADRNILGEIRQERHKAVKDPTPAQIRTYFDEHADEFLDSRKLKADQIWCKDLEAARNAKAELDEGRDFASVKKKYSLDKESQASDLYLSSEAYFWDELWKGDPNEIVGPLKGTYKNEFKWRIVKILGKTPGSVREFSDSMGDQIKWKIRNARGNASLEKFGDELLRKYDHKIYAERVKEVDPLDIP